MLFQQGAAPSHFHVSFLAGLLRIEIFHYSGFAEAALSLGNLVSLTSQHLSSAGTQRTLFTFYH